DIHSPNDLWDALKESRDVDSATPINRFDLESFTAHMDNNGQLHQKLLRVGYFIFLQHLFIGAQSPGGRSRSFSVDANSYVKDDGLCVLLLKQLSDAERDGDPIEANCLDRFFNRSNLDPPLLLDLLKSNLGHTEGAAGVISLIKVAMCMYHRDIIANMQFTSLNPKTDAQKYNLHILQNFVPFSTLPNNDKIAIGVNSFGMGGTTTHAITEEYQPNKTSIENGHIDDNHIKSKHQYFIFIFSNHNDDQAFLQCISQQLLLKRTVSYQHSAIFVFLNRQQLQEQINAFLTEQASPGLSIISRPTKPLAQKICFVFSGQGPQWWAMGRQLYESEPLFNKWINLIDGEMTKINNGEWRLLEELIEKKNEQESRINDTNIAQPTLFTIQVALTVSLISWKIDPSSIISHSAGDQAAAFVAGRLSLEEAIRMLAVSMSEEEIENKLLKGIEHLACIAFVNSPRSVTISSDEIQQILSISYPNVFEARLHKAANVFLEISSHLVLVKSIRECYELTNQQQSSPLILPTLKRKENEQITLLSSLAQLTTSSHVWQQYFHTRQILPMKNHKEYFDTNRIPTHPLLGIRQLVDQTSATWKSLININLSQHIYLKDYKSQDLILFPAVAYLELATAACQQLLP
ncbi:unnamed protein product, partial [Adineta steineri]